MKDFALIFNLPTLLDPDSYNDGFQAGGGAKVWFMDSLAVRFLVHISHSKTDELDISETDIGLSGARELHFTSKELSPYIDGQVGILMEMETDIDTL